MALLNYAAQRKGKKSGVVGGGGGWRRGGAHFLGVCSRPGAATCFHQRLSPLMQSGTRGNWGTIKPAHCSCSRRRGCLSLSLSLRRSDRMSPLQWPHLPQINPNLAINQGTIRRSRRQVIDILRCMSFVYVARLSQGLSLWMTSRPPVCIRRLIRGSSA